MTLAALAALRLPYLTSPLYILDGDEAVLGIMARHLAAGLDFPLHFAGQSYGLAIFETVPLALAFKLFGESSEVVALTMFLLFSVGLLAYARAFHHLSGSIAWARLLAASLALFPGWVVWSLKARGIYVSGFVLTGFALALLTQPELSRRDVLVAGLLMGLIGLVQPLWLSVTVPLLVLGHRHVRDVAMAGLISVSVWLIPSAVDKAGEAFWQPRPLEGFMLERLQFLPRVLFWAFSGRVAPNEPGFLATILGALGAIGFFGLVAVMAVDARRRRSPLALAIGVAMSASILHIVLLRVWVPRYFLPSTVLAVVATAAWIGGHKVRFRGAARVASLALMGLMALAAMRLSRPSRPTRLAAVPVQDDMRELIRGLEADGVRGVYAQTSDIQWQILFYGRERIPVRGTSREDRFPRFPLEVAEARRSGLPTAFVANVRQLRREVPLDSFPGYRVGERYLRLDDPETMVLFMMGFQADATETPP